MAARLSRRALLAWNIPFLLAFAVLFWLLSTYYYFFFFGPFAYTDDELLKLAERAKPGSLMAYADLKDRVLLPTGISEVVTIDGKLHTSTPYFLMPVGEKYLVVLAQNEAMARHLVAPIDGYPGTSRQQAVLDKFVNDHPEFQGKILPLIMNADAAFTVIGWIVLVLFTPFVLLCLINVIRALRRPPQAAPPA